MDYAFSEDQIAIRDLAGQIFADHASDERLLAMSRAGELFDDKLWQILAEQGLLGISVPEAFGGSGLGLVELCLMLEEQGRYLAPVPLFASAVLGALPLTEFGNDEQQQKYLAPYCGGELKFSAAIAEVGMDDSVAGEVSAKQDGDNWVLSGTLTGVPDGTHADVLLVPATTGDGEQTVFLVAADAAGVTLTGQNIALLGERSARLELNNVSVSADDVLGKVGQGAAIVEWVEARANVAQCGMQVGVTETAMQRTAAYISERKQFGIPLGSFQALAMRMADSYIDVEGIRSTYWLALWRLSENLDARAEVRAAKYWACDAAHRVVLTAQHLHGGIGADVEYPIHRFYLWAKHISHSLGNGDTQLNKLGALLAADDSLGFRPMEV